MMSNHTADDILIVDADPEFRRSLKRILQKAGYTVSSVSGASQAGEILAQKTYQLIFLDLDMPGKSGLKLLHQVKETSPESKIIMITVDSSVDNYTKAMNDGAFAFLHKPIKMKKILTYTRLALTTTLIKLNHL